MKNNKLTHFKLIFMINLIAQS